MALVDSYGRQLTYLRLAVTDRCNLRCNYCMPEDGIDFVSRNELLSYEESSRLLKILSQEGIKKLRITGGEPFVRKDLMSFLKNIQNNAWFHELHLTTNATLTETHIPELTRMGLSGVNISLDTLRSDKFLEITRRDTFETVMKSVRAFIQSGIPVKINMVVMAGINEDEIAEMASLAKHDPVEVRFLEEMPFNGVGMKKIRAMDHVAIYESLTKSLGKLIPKPMKSGQTSQTYQIPGFKGSLGIIASFSRTFCGTCNRLRITPTGILRTCLYGSGVLDFRDYLRNDATEEQIVKAVRAAVKTKAENGFEAEKLRIDEITESMATIGG